MHLLLTRPEAGPEPDPLQAALIEAGHRVTQAPLLSVTLSEALPVLNGVQGLIATSRNGLKAIAAGSLDEHALALPLFAVGPATAALARSLGFRRVIEGPGTGRELADVIRAEAMPSAGPILHLAGDTLAFDLKSVLAASGFDVQVAVVYRTEPAPSLPADAVAALRAGLLDGVVLMSPRTAKIYGKLVADAAHTAEAAGLVHFCLSDAVARELAVLGPVRTAVARSPNSQEMLALIAREASDSA
jgi:uroporphyrinogen-III synthase